jgi:hypothetical protein
MSNLLCTSTVQLSPIQHSAAQQFRHRTTPYSREPRAARGAIPHRPETATSGRLRSSALQRAPSRGALLDRLTKRGREVLRREHDPATVARQLLRLYESIISRPTADPPPPALAAH